jgi:integrase
MASLYPRGDAIYISYRSEDGKRKNKATGLRQSNPGERKQAQRLCDRQTLAERTAAPTTRVTDWLWVDGWIETTWGNVKATTPSLYRSQWRTLQKWLASIDVTGPRGLTREHCLAYPAWRAQHNGRQNTAIAELKLLRQIMKEAIVRKLVTDNPAQALGLKKDDPEESRAWTDAELERVDAELQQPEHRFGWIRVTFLLGRYQAARIGSCAVPLRLIDLKNKTIHFEKPKGGRERAYTQPIDERLVPALTEIVKHRTAKKETTLCDLPDFASLEWRRFLDGLGITDVSHHGLRRTWVTEAAKAGIPEAIACRFSNHSSVSVHRIYQRFTTDDVASMLKRLSPR